jgi:hypothetical protein
LKRLTIIAMLLSLVLIGRVTAGEVLDRVRRDSVVRCASDSGVDAASGWTDSGEEAPSHRLCRGVAIAVLGGAANVRFASGPPEPNTDIAFIFGEVATGRFRLVPGTASFGEMLSVLVPLTSRVRMTRDLAGETVCLMIGSAAQDALETLVRRLDIDITRFGFEEAVEMIDAYAVGRCGVMVGPATWLSGLRGPTGINRLSSRLLAEPLPTMPVFLATDPADTDWTAIVARVAHAPSDRSPRPGSAGAANK